MQNQHLTPSKHQTQLMMHFLINYIKSFDPSVPTADMSSVILTAQGSVLGSNWHQAPGLSHPTTASQPVLRFWHLWAKLRVQPQETSFINKYCFSLFVFLRFRTAHMVKYLPLNTTITPSMPQGSKESHHYSDQGGCHNGNALQIPLGVWWVINHSSHR